MKRLPQRVVWRLVAVSLNKESKRSKQLTALRICISRLAILPAERSRDLQRESWRERERQRQGAGDCVGATKLALTSLIKGGSATKLWKLKPAMSHTVISLKICMCFKDKVKIQTFFIPDCSEFTASIYSTIETSPWLTYHRHFP